MSNMAATRIIVLTDASQVAAINNALKGTSDLYEICFTSKRHDFIKCFNEATWDLVLASFDYPQGCIEVLDWVRAIAPYIPFLIIADRDSDTLSKAVLQHKANDYLNKSALHRLPELVQRECGRLQQLKKIAAATTFTKTLHAISDAVITCDENGLISALNPAAEKLLRRNYNTAQGRHITELVTLIDETHNSVINTAFLLQQVRPIALRLENPLSESPHGVCYVEITANQLKLEQESKVNYVLVLRDITETKRLLHQLSHDASHDPLTNLLNRREFEKRLARFLGKANAQHCGVLLYFDLDQFKVVNDSCGHHAGDELLRQVSNLLHSQVRERDTLARLGGDEFALLMECCDINQASRIAQNILKSFQQFRFYWPEHLFQVGVSIGVIPIDHADMHVEKILNLADQACYAAKEAGRNRFILMRDQEANTQQRQRDMHWATLLNEALQQNNFQLYRQKIQPISSNHAKGEHFEILLRLIDPKNHRTISPNAFLNSAERYDLLPAIDYWVVRSMLQWFEDNPNQQDKLASCNINLSGRTISDEQHSQRILEMVKSSHLPAEKICFEITEAAAIASPSLAAGQMNSLRSLGCKFALDDFGVGLASFNYLKSLPVDILKIDGSFVIPMLENPVDHAMVRSINEVGHILGKQTIAESVNSKQLLDGLTAIGIDFVQGYHIAKPAPLSGAASVN